MRCPKCDRNTKASAATPRCVCGHKFAFNPHVDGIADRKFHRILLSVSSDEKVWFTRNQLYAEACRKLAKPVAPALVGGIVFLIATIVLAFLNVGVWAAICAGIAVIYFIVAGSRSGAGPRFTKKQIGGFLDRWIAKSGRPPTLLDKTTLGSPPPEAEESDLYDYGVEAILIVQHDLLVDLFVKNDFHADRRCLVISSSGYPEYLIERAKLLMAESDELRVAWLHDAPRHPQATGPHEGEIAWLETRPREILDLGLSSEQARTWKALRFVRQGPGTIVPVDSLSWRLLSAMTATALASGESYEEIVERRTMAKDGDGGVWYG